MMWFVETGSERKSSWRRVAAAAVAAVVLPVQLADQLEAQVEGLFSAVEPALARRFASPDAVGAPGITTVRSRLVQVDEESLAAARGVVVTANAAEPGDSSTLTLNLFDDVVLSGIVEGTDLTASGTGYVLFGRLDGVDLGTMTLLVYEEGVVGTVRTPSANYRIRPLGDGVHAVSQVDTSMLPPESEPLPPSSPSPDADSGSPLNDSPTLAADDGSMIDVAVFYTMAAEDKAPGLTGIAGITGLVDKMVADSNIAYSQSQVVQRIRRVHLQRVNDFNQYGSVLSSTALNALRDNDGLMDEVHRMRDLYGADLVHLIADLDGSCGRAFKLSSVSNASRSAERGAFGVTDYSCHWKYSFAHELGHNMGLSHDRYAERCVDRDTGKSVPCKNNTIVNAPHAYSFGYVNQRAFDPGASSSRHWRTIMAYENQCDDRGIPSCARIRYFSNPNQSHSGGDPRGVHGQNASQSSTGPSNAARTLDETRMFVANYRPSRSSGSPDLVVQSPRASIATLAPGQSFRMTVVVYNTGAAMSEFNFVSLQYYRSTDSVIRESDTPVRNTQAVQPLGAGASTTESIQLTAPTAAGIYYYGACVSAATESITTNNCSAGVRLTVTVAGSCTNLLGLVSGTVTRTGAWTGSCLSRHYPGGEYARYYSFTLGTSSFVTIDLTSPSVDTWLALRHGGGYGTGLVQANNDGGSSTNARIVRLLPAGAYTIEATTLRGGVTGPFALTLSATPSSTISFTDDPVVAGTTVVKATHFVELRNAIDGLRLGRGLQRYNWADPTIRSGATRIRAVHLTQMRASLNEVYRSAGRPLPLYTDMVRPGLTRVKAMHINQLRRAVEAFAQPQGTLCTSVVLSPSSASVPWFGTERTPLEVRVAPTPASCHWTARSDSSFIAIVGGASGRGAGRVRYTVDVNNGCARSGTLTIANGTFTLSQGTDFVC